jgi:hypothetical protein
MRSPQVNRATLLEDIGRFRTPISGGLDRRPGTVLPGYRRARLQAGHDANGLAGRAAHLRPGECQVHCLLAAESRDQAGHPAFLFQLRA